MLSPSGVQVSTRKVKCVRVVTFILPRPQSSSASRFTAGAAGFLNLSRSVELPEYGFLSEEARTEDLALLLRNLL
jgi:hypothetical protein